MGPSIHLSWKELACKDGTPYPYGWRANRAIQIGTMFEGIRILWGKAISIHSAYRTKTHNKSVGGAKNSQHLQGLALDLKPPQGVPIDAFYKTIKENAKRLGIKGIGRYKTFIHVDLRGGDTLVLWNGPGVSSDLL